MQKVIIIGSNHHNTLGMIRCLGRCQLDVDLILIGHDGYVSKSRHINKTIVISDAAFLVETLLKHYGHEKDKPIIITCTDISEHILDINYDNLSDKFLFFNCQEQGRITHFMNKQVQADLAESAGLNVPYSQVYDDDLSDVTFPCIIKPNQSISGGKKVSVCNNLNALREALKDFSEIDSILIQPFIKKDGEIVVLGYASDNHIVIPGYIIKHRDNNGGTLYSSVSDSRQLPSEFIDKIKRFISYMNYDGLFGVEFIIDNGTFYFIEANLRNDATTYALAVAGANLADYYIKSKISNGFIPKYEIKGIDAIVEFNDFKHRKENDVSIFKWLNQLRKSECKYYWDIKDPLPFLFAPFKS